MKNKVNTTQNETEPKGTAAVYERPLIIYDGVISTRAGSPLGGNNGNGADGVDPANLFD